MQPATDFCSSLAEKVARVNAREQPATGFCSSLAEKGARVLSTNHTSEIKQKPKETANYFRNSFENHAIILLFKEARKGF